MSLTNWKVRTQIKGRPTVIIRTFCQPQRQAVQMASRSLSRPTARIVAPMGPMPKKVTPIPWGTQTTCWYFQPVARMTNSVTVAMASNGSVKYEMRFVFNRCHGEKPASFPLVPEESCEFMTFKFFIKKESRVDPEH